MSNFEVKTKQFDINNQNNYDTYKNLANNIRLLSGVKDRDQLIDITSLVQESKGVRKMIEERSRSLQENSVEATTSAHRYQQQ